ncbi:MAG: class I SAM-dependent methyltransferase [Chloroflexi bacterium]|nr:class I SAM-dependent methyltransferase [Chloroflexota bacterium]
MRRAWRQFVLCGFDLLYGPLAPYYDFISSLISAGQWQQWGQTVSKYLTGSACLEIGPGPGHLLQFLTQNGFRVVGIDRSPEMVRLIQRNWHHQAAPPVCGGTAQILPFSHHQFDNIIMSFPAPFVLEDTTLAEVKRCLRPGGRLIIVSSGWQRGNHPASLLRNFLLTVTGDKASILPERLRTAGFSVSVENIHLARSQVDLIVATPPKENQTHNSFKATTFSSQQVIKDPYNLLT